MIPNPVALGLTVCDYVIVEERTRKVSLIGSFTGIAVDQFPVIAQPFSVFAVLTDSIGDGTLELVVAHAGSGEEVYSHRSQISFPNKLAEVSFHLRLRQCSFPAAGYYTFTLLIDGQWVAQRVVRVYAKET